MIELSFNAKQILAIIAALLTLVAFIPYIQSILTGQTKPHIFTWIIWGLTTFIVFLAQLADQGGMGAWPIGLSGILTMSVALLAYVKKSDSSITRTDWAFFIAAISAIPFWYITTNPLSAVIILTTVDVIGFLPTIRKVYHKPHEDRIFMYVLMIIRNMVATLALEHYSLTTMLFPLVMIAAAILYIAIIIVRRRILTHSAIIQP